MTVHVFVEGPSETSFFDGWIPRLKANQRYRIHHHQGKGSLPKALDRKPDPDHRGLLDQLPAKLRAFSTELDPRTDGIIVLIDADDEDPAVVRKQLEAVAKLCCPSISVKVCVAVEEMEAFYLSDLAALTTAYPDHDAALARAYVPDSICGTWERFGQVVGDDGGNKVMWGERMGDYVTNNPAVTRSPSFKLLLRAFKDMEKLPVTVPPAKKKHRHAAKPRRP